MPWFSKQSPALAYDNLHSDHIVIAEDVSQHGHKRYGVFPLTEVDNFTGPHNELIRTHCPCRLYFDLDGRQPVSPGAVPTFIAAVLSLAGLSLKNTPVIVLDSSTATKFSKHLVFPEIVFKDNWTHMRNWVLSQNLPHASLIDRGVYTRNRCFRMAGCCKFGDASRPFLPGPPSSALVQCASTNCSTNIQVRECGSEPRSLLPTFGRQVDGDAVYPR